MQAPRRRGRSSTLARFWTCCRPPGSSSPPPQADGMAGYVNSVAQRRPFTREALIGWMRSQCFQGFEIDMPPANHVAYRAEVEDRIDELQRRGGTYDLTYVRIDALVYRPA